MRCFTFSVFAASGLLLAGTMGCHPPTKTASVSDTKTVKAPTTASPLAESSGKMLPDAAREHPAPEGTPGVDTAETAQAAHPTSAPDNLHLGLAYYKVGAWQQAIPALETASRLAPTETAPLLYLGYAQMATGSLASAEKTLAKAAALPSITPAAKSDALLQRGNCLYAQGDDKTAHTAFTQSLAVNPKQGMAALALGTLAAQGKRSAEAKTFFVRATRDLTESSQKARAFACLGLLAESEKQPTEATSHYQKAIALDKQNSPAREGLARLTKKKS